LTVNLKNRSFLTLKDFTEEEILYLIDYAIKVKSEKKRGIYKNRLKNKNIAMIFELTSTRTRCATSTACFDEGAHAEYLGKNEIQLGKKESLKDTIRVLERMFDAILFRGYKHETIEKIKEYSNIPVINALTDKYHPTQILADLMTIKERFGKFKGLKLVYLGDGNNNMSNGLLIGSTKVGLDITIAAPKKYWPDKNIVNYVEGIKKNSKIEIIDDPIKAVKGADIIYTDVWVSMNQENDKKNNEKIKLLKPFQVTAKLMSLTGKETTIFLHCLPAAHEEQIHNMEVTDDVFESGQSFVFDQAENRLHTIKAILISIIRGK
jgi:ornithine carbamoyltransferase